jgi:hypothetical protein
VRAQGALMQGREAARRLAWSDAYTALSLADSSSPLAAQDLELLATAALLLGHVEDGLRAPDPPGLRTTDLPVQLPPLREPI